MYRGFIGLLIIAVILQGTVTSLPLVLLCLILLAVKTRTSDVFLIAFLSGLILDIMLVHPIGESSIFFLTVLLVIFLYERKYELSSLVFILSVTGVMTFLSSFLFPSPQRFLQIVLAVVINGFLFTVIEFITTPKRRNYERV